MYVSMTKIQFGQPVGLDIIKFFCFFNISIKISKTRYTIEAIRLMIHSPTNQEQGTGTISKCKNLEKVFPQEKGGHAFLDSFRLIALLWL